jgi:hypothetical protein
MYIKEFSNLLLRLITHCFIEDTYFDEIYFYRKKYCTFTESIFSNRFYTQQPPINASAGFILVVNKIRIRLQVNHLLRFLKFVISVLVIHVSLAGSPRTWLETSLNQLLIVLNNSKGLALRWQNQKIHHRAITTFTFRHDHEPISYTPPTLFFGISNGQFPRSISIKNLYILITFLIIV